MKLSTVVAAVVFSGLVYAQEFEVASIKRLMPTSMGQKSEPGSRKREPTILRIRRQPLTDIVRWAYDLKASELLAPDGSQWRETDGMQYTYDVEAHFEASATNAEVKKMLQNLLHERLGLVAHREVSEVEGYVVRLGSKGLNSKTITPSTDAPDENTKPVFFLHPGSDRTKMTISVNNASISEILDEVSRMMRYPISDSTGLLDRYDAKWGIDFALSSNSIEGRVDAFLESLKTLGLNAQGGKVKIKGLIVDQISKDIKGD